MLLCSLGRLGRESVRWSKDFDDGRVPRKLSVAFQKVTCFLYPWNRFNRIPKAELDL